MRMRRFGLVLFLALLAFPLAAAELSGRWHFVFDTEAGVREADMTLEVNERQVTGKVTMPGAPEKSAEVTGKFADGQVTLDFPYYSEEAGYQSTVKLQGKLGDDTIAGEWQFDQYKGTFTAKRVKQSS
jgi:hypothetical protein